MALDIPRGRLAEVGDAELILAAYERWGERCSERLLGDFAFAIADPANGRLFAARDPVGARPLYYLTTGSGLLAVSTTPAPFHGMGDGLVPDEGWIARYLIGASADRVVTPWRTVTKLPPAHMLVASDGRVQVRRYFSFEPSVRAEVRDSGTWVEAYRERLEEAVRCRVPVNVPVGCESSGGIDSSSVLGLAACVLPAAARDLHTFSAVTHADVPGYVLETSLWHGLLHNHVFVAPGSVLRDEDDARILRLLGHPAEHSYSRWAMPFYRLAEPLGIGALLSGFGGDEVVTAPADQVPRELWRRGERRSLLRLFGGSAPAQVSGLGRWWLRTWRGGGANRLAVRYRRQQDTLWPYFPLRPEAAREYALHERFVSSADFIPEADTVNAAAVALLDSGYLPTRLEECALLARGHGIDYGWPLLDRRLIEQWLATPPDEKWRSRYGRYLHRRAMNGVIPDKVLWKPGKGMGAPVRRADDGGRAQAVLAAARRVADTLHPALEPLIDRNRLREQIKHVEAGASGALANPFRLTVRRLAALDAWLKAYHP